jgi:drug/metabolite transporter (DMT)-like permease
MRSGGRIVALVTNTALGALCAVTASSLFSIGLVLQALEARSIPAGHSFRLSLIGQLLKRRRWVLGGFVMLIGFGFHITAFLTAPLTVVQPSLAFGLLVLLGFGLRAQGESMNRREAIGVAGIIVGVVALTFTTPSKGGDDAGARSLIIALGALAVIALIPHLGVLVRRRRGGATTMLATLGAGAGYALTGLTTKLLSDAAADSDWLASAFWLAITMIVALLAFIDQNSALQEGDVVEVGPIVFVVPIVVPVLLAPALVGEGWGDTPLGALPMLLSLAVVCVGAFTLSGSTRVAAAS